jgi:hypothetical protein
VLIFIICIGGLKNRKGVRVSFAKGLFAGWSFANGLLPAVFANGFVPGGLVPRIKICRGLGFESRWVEPY